MCVWKAQEVRQDSVPIRVSFASEPTDFLRCESFSLIIYSYVQMLERQHAQLITGLQEFYRRTQNSAGWTGPHLEVVNHDQPLTHKILEALGVLQIDEWEETESVDGTWRGTEEQGQDNNGWMYPESASPSRQGIFSPESPTQTAFAQSRIMSKRRSIFRPNLPPVTQTLMMPPPLITTSASVKLERYNYASPNQLPAPLDIFTSNESMKMDLDRGAGSTMDWSLGMDDLFGGLGAQEHLIKGC